MSGHVREDRRGRGSETERLDPAMLDMERMERDRAGGGRRPVKGPSRSAGGRDRIEAAGRLDEGIGEARIQLVGGVGVGPDRQAGPTVEHDNTEIVDAVDMVGMGMVWTTSSSPTPASSSRARMSGRYPISTSGRAIALQPLDQQRAAAPGTAARPDRRPQSPPGAARPGAAAE